MGTFEPGRAELCRAFYSSRLWREDCDRHTNVRKLPVHCHGDTAVSPILTRVAPGTHVTCVGTDSPGKNEVGAAVFAAADLIVVDSLAQCLTRGDFSHAVVAGLVSADKAVELGTLLASGGGRRNDNDITVADLTGLAVQDIRIAGHVLATLIEEL